MDEEKMHTAAQQGQKTSLESLSKEELIQKYKGLLAIAKKAKQAKDEIVEENRSLKEQLVQLETQKEADKKALMTMKEMLEAYTDNKLQLTTTVSELEKTHKLNSEKIETFSIENESLKRQIQRLREDNESLLRDVENMEGQLKQVSGLSKGQKEQIVLLEKEVRELKKVDMESQEIKQQNHELCNELQELKEKYKFIKDINSEQRQKFNSLKNRFIEVLKKLKKLKECKQILLETQHEYADAVSQWQCEIIEASKLLCKELNSLKEENIKLLQVKESLEKNIVTFQNLDELLQLSETAKKDFNQLQEENTRLKKYIEMETTLSSLPLECSIKTLDELWQLSETALQEYNAILNENIMLKEISNSKYQFSASKTEFEKLEELEILALKAHEEYVNQAKDIEILKEHSEKLQNENDDFKKQSQNLLTAQNSLQNCTNETEQLKEKINLLEQEKVLYQNQIHELEILKQHPSISHNLDNSLNETKNNDELLLNIASKEQEEKHRFEYLTTELKNVTDEKLTLVAKLIELETSAEVNLNLKDQLLSSQQLLEEYQQKYKHKETEHAELLDEMRELNEALKARGDLISRQQEEYHILKSELKNNSDKLSKIQQEIDKKDIQLSEKQTEIENIKKEMTLNKQKLETLENANSLNEEKVRVLSTELDNIKSNPSAANTGDFDNQSDILSTSTYSRADELQRFKDVEDSFEDKYNKLRCLAAKLKKRLQEESGLKQRFEKEIQDLKKHEKELNLQVIEFKNRTLDMEMLHKKINEKQKQIDSLKTENQKLKSSRQQANVLNLEIEAAEKSLTEVTNKLSSRNVELEAAQEALKGKESAIVQLRKEIDLLETSKTAEIKHSQELKQQIDHLHKTLKDEMHSKQQAYEKSKLLEQDVENLKQELENAKVELAQSTSNQEKLLMSLNNEREKLSLQVSATKTALSECEQKLKKADRANEDLRVEYLDYKVKAQTVLRSNQNRDSSKERELEEELVAMRASETRLNTTIGTLTLKVESLEKQIDLLNEDNASLKKHSRELVALIEDVRTQNEALNQEIQQHIQQQYESLKQHRKQIESIDSCHKEQIESINISHQRQLEQLRKDLSQQNIRLITTVGETKATNLPLHAHDHNDAGKLDFLLMEREDAEGSEEAAETLANLAASRKISNDSSSAKRSAQDFMPLDELLNTPLNAISSETLITNSQHQYFMDTASNAENSMDFLQLELNSTKERLQKQESRVRHLTALLAENEQDLAKLTQMNDMLKEELRRQERSVEREQHMHNSEYVKNVIMKFLTLNNSDEKTRLVPVLNTILKLSRSEAEMLNCVAKGQKVSETSQRMGGWSSFLPWGTNSNNN